MRRTSRAALLTGVALSSLGCAPSFDPPQELETLRVLGVQKDKPYAAPGEEVTLSVLWHDASGQERPVQRAWLAGCVNPPGDLYQGCFPLLSDPANPKLLLESGDEPENDQFTFTVPDDILGGRTGAPGQPPYGLSYVFFAVCAGTLKLEPIEGLPVTCRDAAGELLGPDDFVVGYTAIYTFADIGNQNPVISGFTFRGEAVAPDCTGIECLTRPIVAPDCSQEGAVCVPACPEDGEPECDEYEAEAVVDQMGSVEPDEVSRIAYGSDFDEQLWTNYYVDRGSISPGVKLVNDATKGWNDEQEVDFRAPREPGPATIWAVVHDNRGGVEFVRFTLGVQ